MAIDNYQIQAANAKALFLTYDQEELISRCRLAYDRQYLYAKLLSAPYRICRQTGNMQRQIEGGWVDSNSFAEVMTLLDWLCDSRPDRYVTGRWINIVNHGHYFHRDLQEDMQDSRAKLFSENPSEFSRACEALGGQKMQSGDLSYAIELLDGLPILVQLWHGDEEFPPRLCCLWDENTTRYIRYETSWYVLGLLMDRLEAYIVGQKENSAVDKNR